MFASNVSKFCDSFYNANIFVIFNFILNGNAFNFFVSFIYKVNYNNFIFSV